MLRRTLFAALLSTTMLTSPAYAMPPVVAVVGAITAAAAAATTFLLTTFTGLGVALGFGASAGFFGVFVTKLVVGIGLAALARALMPRPKIPDPSDRMANFAQPVAYFETVYGRVRKGGPLGFTSFADSRRHYVVILASHRIKGVVRHFLDEWDFPLSSVDPNGLVQDGRTIKGGRRHASIRTYRGTTNQSADPQLVSSFPEWTSSHDMSGLAYAALWARRPKSENFSDVFPNGRQWAYTPVIEGKDTIFDPRDGTEKYTNNAALVIADWVVTVLGKEVDWDEVAAEADWCDTLVPKKGGGTQRRWTINGVIDDQLEFEDVRAQFAGACDAFFYETPEGKVGFKVGRYDEPTITLTEDDFYSATITEGEWGIGAPNEVVGRYVEPENNYRETPTGTIRVDDEDRPIRDEIALYMIDNHNQACRVIKRLIRAKRSKYTITAVMKLVGYKMIGHRFVRIVHSQLGIDEVFEIARLTRSEDGIVFELEANSTQPSDWTFDPDEEEPTQPAYGKVTAIPDDLDPTNITASTETLGGVAGVAVQWTPAQDTSGHQVRHRLVGATDWIESENLMNVTSRFVGPLEDQQTYQFQVRSTSGNLGAPRSEWLPITPLQVQVVLNTTPPAQHISFSAGVVGSDVTLTYRNPNDVNFFATRIYRATYSSGFSGPFLFGDAVLIATELGAPNTVETYNDTGLSPSVVVYWLQPINSSGVAGPISGPEDVEVV